MLKQFFVAGVHIAAAIVGLIVAAIVAAFTLAAVVDILVALSH